MSLFVLPHQCIPLILLSLVEKTPSLPTVAVGSGVVFNTHRTRWRLFHCVKIFPSPPLEDDIICGMEKFCVSQFLPSSCESCFPIKSGRDACFACFRFLNVPVCFRRRCSAPRNHLLWPDPQPDLFFYLPTKRIPENLKPGAAAQSRPLYCCQNEDVFMEPPSSL